MFSKSYKNIAADPNERRQSNRRDVHLVAKAGVRGGVPMRCTIRNISAMGALLEFPEPVQLPKHFRISIDSALFSAECEVRHHTDRMAGVMFISNRMEALAAFG